MYMLTLSCCSLDFDGASIHTLRKKSLRFPSDMSDEDDDESSLTPHRPSSRPPPLVTVHSPIVTPQDSPISPGARANGAQQPSISSTSQALQRMASQQVNEEDDSEPPSPPKRKTRPITFISTPNYSHDTELSDALRWEERGPMGLEEDASPVSPSDPLNSVPGFEDDNMDPATPTETETDDTETNASLNNPVYGRRAFDGTSVDANRHGLAEMPKTADDYDFLSETASVLSGASLAAQQARLRLRRSKGAEPDSTEVTRRDSLAPGQALPVVDPGTGGQRRERRRVNISGKFLPLQQQNPSNLLPIPEPSDPRAEAADSNDSSPTRSLRMRSRAGTEPRQGSIFSEAAHVIRRQASSDALVPPQRASASLRPLSRLVFADGPTNLAGIGESKGGSMTSSRRNSYNAAPSSSSAGSSLTFPLGRTEVRRPALPAMSALTTMLSQQSESSSGSNPYTADYGALAIRGAGPKGLKLRLFFPHSKTKAGKKCVEVRVRKDITVEEVIGSGLLAYWDDGMEPPLLAEADAEAWDGETLIGRLDPAAWNLRIVEDDDGEVDDDFPGMYSLRAQLALTDICVQRWIVREQYQPSPSLLLPL